MNAASPNSAKTRGNPRNVIWAFGGLLVAVFIGSIAIAVLNQPEFTGDPAIYRERMALLFDGAIPYYDFDFEHFPLAGIPMALAWIAGGFLGPDVFTIIFGFLMAACLLMTAELVFRLETVTGTSGVTERWIAVAAPLVPIVLFRSDPFPTVLAVAALYTAAVGQERRSLWWELGGTFAKGWPALLAISDWIRGRRVKALIVFCAAIGLVGTLILSPGFTQSRTFSGLHSESVVGAALIGFRTITGQPLQLLYEAGATYVEVPFWGWILNLNVGLCVALVVFARFRRFARFVDVPRFMAASILALLLISPLLSPQFLIWVTPFIVFFRSRKVFGLAVAVTGLTLLYMTGWNSDFLGNPWWVYVLNLRNIALVALAVLCAWRVGGGAADPGPHRVSATSETIHPI